MKRVSSGLLVFLFLTFLCFFIFWGVSYQWETVFSYRRLFFQGLTNTLLITFIALLSSLALGLFWMVLRRSSVLFFRYLAQVYIITIRGTPFLVQILFFYYVVAQQIGLQNRYMVGIFILSTFSSAYIAEIIRAGVESVKSSHLETAKAIGLTRTQTYFNVVIPQAFKQMMPPLTGQLVSLIKDSSLLSVIGIGEMTFSAEQISSATFSTLESFFPLALGYLILSLPIIFLSQYLERRYAYED